MGIAIGTDDRGYINAVAADVGDHVTDDREAGDDRHLLLRERGQRQQGKG